MRLLMADGGLDASRHALHEPHEVDELLALEGVRVFIIVDPDTPAETSEPQYILPEEIAAIKRWLKREGTCLMFAPHHDVGASKDFKQRQMEYRHHRDALVPRQQRFSQYTRSLMKGLGIPVWNEWGLRPAVMSWSLLAALPRTGSRHPGPTRCRSSRLGPP